MTAVACDEFAGQVVEMKWTRLELDGKWWEPVEICGKVVYWPGG